MPGAASFLLAAAGSRSQAARPRPLAHFSHGLVGRPAGLSLPPPAPRPPRPHSSFPHAHTRPAAARSLVPSLVRSLARSPSSLARRARARPRSHSHSLTHTHRDQAHAQRATPARPPRVPPPDRGAARPPPPPPARAEPRPRAAPPLAGGRAGGGRRRGRGGGGERAPRGLTPARRPPRGRSRATHGGVEGWVGGAGARARGSRWGGEGRAGGERGEGEPRGRSEDAPRPQPLPPPPPNRPPGAGKTGRGRGWFGSAAAPRE